jgi:putative methionine-R-sulfoxide reductase with GAF domain
MPPGNTRSELCVPLLYNGEVVGVLDIQSDN